jgi:FtsZ-interacting cell division protein ZipA
LQLADRSGPVNRVQLSTMRDLVHELADRVAGACECPDIDWAAQTATELDQFCAQVDVSIGCNVVPNSGGGLSGTKVRGLLESAGFNLESSGRFVLRMDDGSIMMWIENIDGEALSAERLRAAPLAGLTLTMDVPRVPAGGRVFERMLELGRHLAHALDATVVDDNRARLTDAGIKLIRQQLRNVHAAMEAQGIPAGGALAARLFS